MKFPVKLMLLLAFCFAAVAAGNGVIFDTLITSVSAQAPAKDAAEPIYVTPHLVANTTGIVAGEKFKIGVHLDMAPNWHTYYKEPGDAGMKTSIDWQLPPGFKASELIWQKPEKFVDAGIVTYGYHDKALLAAEVTAPSDLKAGTMLTFKASVKWLSCKDICLPGKGEVTLQLPVVNKGEAIASPQAAEFDALGNGFTGSVKDLEAMPTSSKTGPLPTDKVSVLDANYKVDGTADGGLLGFLGGALVGGLILNIMPCVLPVIAIKVMSFLEQAQDSPARVRLLGIVFSAGIISSFMALAALVIALKAAGQTIGWGFQFQYPGFLIIMCAVVLLMSLSFFGLFYVNIAVNQDVDKLSQKEGIIGTFFKGVLATVLSTPCTAPLLAPALGFAFAQPAHIIAAIFFSAGLGMSLPYLLLTFNPAWLQKLPKPGAWMEKFKQSMGFILLATMVWLDFVLTKQIGAEPASFVNYWLVALAFAAWIVASFTDLTSSVERKTKVWTIAVLMVVAMTWLCLIAQPQVWAALLNTQTDDAPAPQSTSGDYVNFTVEKLNQLLSENKTVLLDFTADWCQTCQVNEKTVLSNSAVQAKIKALGVVSMRADWTKQDPDITKLLSKFGRAGVPLYVIFPAGKAQSPIVLPEIITVQLVLDSLDKAGKSQ